MLLFLLQGIKSTYSHNVFVYPSFQFLRFWHLKVNIFGELPPFGKKLLISAILEEVTWIVTQFSERSEQ